MRASYLEIYNEDVRDLLASNPRAALELREDADGGVYAKGLHAFLVQSPADLASVLQVATPSGLRFMLTQHMHAVPVQVSCQGQRAAQSFPSDRLQVSMHGCVNTAERSHPFIGDQCAAGSSA